MSSSRRQSRGRLRFPSSGGCTPVRDALRCSLRPSKAVRKVPGWRGTAHYRSAGRRAFQGPLAATLIGTIVLGPAFADTAAVDKDEAIAASLAEMVRDARTVISNNQDLINNPQIGDKHLGGKKVLDDAMALYHKNTGVDPATIDPNSRRGHLLRDMMNAIVEVMNENQDTINDKGVGFKGFIPAVFGRLVSEAFNGLAENEAVMKITAPPDLVRNIKARPDPWETEVIEQKFLSPSWPKGQPFAADVMINGAPAYRVAVPEYYKQSCLACHGSPKGDLDITGYPKEGRKLGDLGGVISITLLR
jgi:archaellum component FlaG (FlaF/FlaG flagellin family)